MSKLSKPEVIVLLCELVSKVGVEKFGNKYMHDCFCGLNTVVGFKAVDEEVIQFIADAIEEKMSK